MADTQWIQVGPKDWVEFPKDMPDDDITRVLRQQQPPKTDYGPLVDVGRGALKGIVEGPTTDIAGLPGDIRALAGRGIEALTGTQIDRGDLPTSQELSEGIYKLPGPQTAPGRVAETVGRTVTNPLNLLVGPEAAGARSLARRAASAGASGLGAGLGEEASKQTGIPGLGFAGGIAGSVAADLAPGALARRRYKAELGRALSQEELFDVGGQLHEKLQDLDTPIPGGDVQRDLVKPIRELFRRKQFFPEDEPATFRHLNRLTQTSEKDSQLAAYQDLAQKFGNDPADLRQRMMAAAQNFNDVDMQMAILQSKGAAGAQQMIANRMAEQEAKPIGSGEIYGVRTALRKVAQNNPSTSEGKAAGTAVDMIDDYLENIPGYEDMKTARAVWRAARSSERYTEAIRKGEGRADVSGSGANTVNTLRQEIRKIRENRKITREPVENELMDEITHGTDLGNWARVLSKLGPRHPLSGWGTVLTAMATGHADLGLTAVFLGQVAHYLSESSTRGGIEELEQTVRRRAPPSVAKYGPPPVRPPPVPAGKIGAAAALRAGTEALRPSTDDDALAPR